jgi:hypothetical protein
MLNIQWLTTISLAIEINLFVIEVIVSNIELIHLLFNEPKKSIVSYKRTGGSNFCFVILNFSTFHKLKNF